MRLTCEDHGTEILVQDGREGRFNIAGLACLCLVTQVYREADGHHSHCYLLLTKHSEGFDCDGKKRPGRPNFCGEQ